MRKSLSKKAGKVIEKHLEEFKHRDLLGLLEDEGTEVVLTLSVYL